jgi:hypothetical protein
VDNEQHEMMANARRSALAFQLGFGELKSSTTLVEWVDGLLEGYALVDIKAVNIPDSVKFGKTTDTLKKVPADYTHYRNTHFSTCKCSPQCPFCRRQKVVAESLSANVVYYRETRTLWTWFYPVEKLKNGNWKGQLITWYKDDRTPRKAAQKSVSRAFAAEFRTAKPDDIPDKVKKKFAQKGINL